MFYTYRQMNSGSYHHINEKVAEFVIVEAANAKDAKDKFLDSIVDKYYFGCACGTCSDRWNDLFDLDDDDGTEFPSINGFPPEAYRYKGWMHATDERTCVIYYQAGTRKYIHYNGELLSPYQKEK